jgi:[ribosomal protein S18]-alanine N-acetyltransferase
MIALKPKRKPASAAKPAKNWKAMGDRAMQKLFGLPPDWYQKRDIVKNNFELGVRNFRLGNATDAWLRFAFTTRLNPKHAEAWHYLGRTYLIQGKRAAAVASFEKAIELNPANEGAKKILAAIPVMYDAETPPVTIKEVGIEAALTLSALHRDSFVGHWEEKEFFSALTIEGTKAWITGLADLPMSMILGRSLKEQYEILTLCVNPDWRGRGLARQLLEKLTARAKETGAKTIFLEVADDNKAARKFYEGAGFTEINRRKDYYKQEDGSVKDAIVMRLELSA